MKHKYVTAAAGALMSALLCTGCGQAAQQNAGQNPDGGTAGPASETELSRPASESEGGESKAFRFEAEDANLKYCSEQSDPFAEPKSYLIDEGEAVIKKIFGETARAEDVIGILGFSMDEINGWTPELTGASEDASGGKYLRQLDSPENAVRFELHADQAGDAVLTFRVASNDLDWMGKKTNDIDHLEQKMAITVNGTMLDLSGTIIKGSDSLTETAWQDISFETSLNEGDNLIEIYVFSHEEQYARDSFTEEGIQKKITVETVCDKLPNFDYLDVQSAANVTWSETESSVAVGEGVPVLESLEVEVPENYTIYTCESVDVLRYTVTANMSDGSSRDVTDRSIFTGDLSALGEQEFELSYTQNGVTAKGSFTANVESTDFALDQVPEEYRSADAAQKGTVEHMEYTTYEYGEDGEPLEEQTNEAYVYLPAGYSKDQQYNVLYLLHGGGDSAGFWLGQGDYAAGGAKDSSDKNFTVAMLDALIEKGYCEPLIVVTPSLMTEAENTPENAGVNGTSTFQYELKNDLIPAVETTYSTYAGGDVSEENLIATREHRAYDGLSMGSITSFQSVLTGCTDYIGYIGSFSGCKSDVAAVADSLNTDYAQYPILYWYNGNGTVDMAHDEHCEAYKQMLELLPDKLKEGENTLFADKPGQSHSYESWVIDLYNTLGVFF